MAITNLASSSSPFVALNLTFIHRLLSAFSPSSPSRSTNPFAFHLRTRAMGVDLLGDFCARDPFPAELESQFGEKVWGNTDTEHKILILNLFALSFAQQECPPVFPLQSPMSEDDANKIV
ncbi:hypothetical protein K1719_040037 [Acacia pycnantha]|nr:hypothetical protein K1719_040037 [Acacia pycnantha]